MTATVKTILLTLLVISSATLLFAQGGATGTILGAVTDNTGAVLPGASVDVTNVSTGQSQHTVTSDAGDYTLPFLPPGRYTVKVQATGFQAAQSNEITLAVAQRARVDVVMKPGGPVREQWPQPLSRTGDQQLGLGNG
jgi:hypothetical protein